MAEEDTTAAPETIVKKKLMYIPQSLEQQTLSALLRIEQMLKEYVSPPSASQSLTVPKANRRSK